MGGYSSGRYRTRNRGAVEATCRIDLRFLRKRGALKEGHRTTGTLSWTRRGESSGSIGYTVVMDGEDRRLVLSYSTGGEARTVTVQLVAVPMRFGGFRYYARCPRTGRRCLVLPVVGGVIACRQAHRLTYASQSMDRLDRTRELMERYEKRLNEKPRRGWNRVKLTRKWIRASEDFERLCASEVKRRFGHLL
jgi:hypothetical protein